MTVRRITRVYSSIQPFVLGVTKPTAENTGVPTGTSLTFHAGDLDATSDTTYEALDIDGQLVIDANITNVTMRNCRIRGIDTGTSIKCFGPGAHNLLLDRCTIEGKMVTEAEGIAGHHFTAHRCDFSHTADGVTTFNTNNPGTDASVEIHGCYMHDSQFWYPSPNHSDQMTHNDCVQVQGGLNVSIVGNNLRAFIDPSFSTGWPDSPRYPEENWMTAIITTPNVGPVDGLTINRNWLAGGNARINIAEKDQGAIKNLTITNNRFDHSSGFAMLIADATLNDPTFIESGNVYEDTGNPVPIQDGG